MIAFLIIQRDRRLAFVEDAIRQSPALVEQGHGAVEGLADGGLDASEAIALALSCERVRSVLYWRVRFFVSLRWMGVQTEDQIELLCVVQYGAVRVGGVLSGRVNGISSPS